VLLTLAVLLQILPSGIVRASPSPAMTAGYTVLTFSSAMLSSEVDTAQTCPSGKNWYFTNFYGEPPADPSTLTFLSPSGATVGGNNSPSAISTACSGGGSAWHGTAFGGGGYFEVTASWDHSQVVTAAGSGGWPSAWSQTIEHGAGLSGQQWTGQAAGYIHAVEPDIMEDDTWPSHPTTLGMTIHDFWGIANTTCSPDAYCQTGNTNNLVPLPVTTTAHKYAMLWIPATSTSTGSVSFFIDGIAQPSNVSWTQYVAASDSPPPTGQPWVFGVLDGLHIFLELSTGNTQPLTILQVNVWQRSASGNLVQ